MVVAGDFTRRLPIVQSESDGDLLLVSDIANEDSACDRAGLDMDAL